MFKSGKRKAVSALLGATIALTPFSSAFAAADVTTGWDSTKVEIVNNFGLPDVIKVKELPENAVVKVYDQETGGKVLGTAKVAKGKTEAVISIKDLGTDGGKVYISVTLETAAKELTVAKEDTTATLEADKVVVANNVRKPDTVKVTAAEGTTIKVYDKNAADAKVLGSTTVAKGKTEATLSIKQFGADAGKLYVTAKVLGKKESEKLEVSFDAEPVSTKLATEAVTIVNNAGIPDTVKVTGLTTGDIIKVYYKDAASKDVTAIATVAKDKTEALLSIKQLGEVAGTVDVTVTSVDKLEAPKLNESYEEEKTTDAPAAADITVTNNVDISDTVKVVGLTAGTIVNVYAGDAAADAKPLVTATVAKDKTEATLSVKQLGSAEGKVNVTTKVLGKKESAKTEKTFAAEEKSTAPVAANITVTNNTGATADTVKVTGLAAGDKVTVVNKAEPTVVLGTGVVAAGKTEITISLTKKLTVAAGEVQVTVKSTNKLVSDKTDKAYEQEVSKAPVATSITVTNNKVGTDDTVKVIGLVAGDVVNVYAKGDTTVIGTGTVAVGKTDVTITIAQLGTGAGSVEVTVTNKDAKESAKVEKAYVAEPTT